MKEMGGGRTAKKTGIRGRGEAGMVAGSEIDRGKAAKERRVLVGGHSVEDKELKYGLAVIGFIHPGRILTKRNLAVGDGLYIAPEEREQLQGNDFDGKKRFFQPDGRELG